MFQTKSFVATVYKMVPLINTQMFKTRGYIL